MASNMKNLRKLMLSLLVVGIAAGVGVGTFATFNAQTANPNNVFAAGTLVLSDTKLGGSACLSTGGANTDINAGTCDQLLNLTVAKPGDTGSAKLTLRNEGSLNATALKLFSNACVNADAAAEGFHGTGLPCGKIQLTVQQYSDAAFTTPAACLYGASSGASCTFADATKTLNAFSTSFGSAATGLSAGGAISSGASRYFEISVKLPSDAGNEFQGRQGTIGFNWIAEQ